MNLKNFGFNGHFAALSAEYQHLIAGRIISREKGQQVIASNIDIVFICMSLNNDFNVRRLERYLAAVYDSGDAPVLQNQICVLI